MSSPSSCAICVMSRVDTESTKTPLRRRIAPAELKTDDASDTPLREPAHHARAVSALESWVRSGGACCVETRGHPRTELGVMAGEDDGLHGRDRRGFVLPKVVQDEQRRALGSEDERGVSVACAVLDARTLKGIGLDEKRSPDRSRGGHGKRGFPGARGAE